MKPECEKDETGGGRQASDDRRQVVEEAGEEKVKEEEDVDEEVEEDVDPCQTAACPQECRVQQGRAVSMLVHVFICFVYA